jgi:hypothetical protein
MSMSRLLEVHKGGEMLERMEGWIEGTDERCILRGWGLGVECGAFGGPI